MAKKQGACAIIAIGDELLLGEIQDTNSAYLAQRMSEHGFDVRHMEVIGDNEDVMLQAMQRLSAQVDVILVTGGLGPTEDDRTRHVLARAARVELVENKTAWKQVTSYIQRNYPGSAIAESNHRQALMPRGAKILKNDRGTAPGMLMHIEGCYVACFPGVPHEMKAMAARFMQQLPKYFPNIKIPAFEEIHFAGMGESSAQDLLGDLLAGDKPQVGICAQETGHITIRLRGSQSAVKKRSAAIRRLLKSHVLPCASLAESIVHLLTQRKATVTTAESCTCGHIVAALGAVPGASAILHEALIAYHAHVKSDRLGVDAAIIKKHDVVSEEVVTAMVQGAIHSSGADFALGSTGVAGPGGGSKRNPVGTVWVAAASGKTVLTKRLSVRGDRLRVQRRAAAEALRLLWTILIK